MGCSLVLYGILLVLGIFLCGPIVVAFVFHKLANNIYTPSKGWLIANYIIGGFMVPFHWVSLGDEDEWIKIIPCLLVCIFGVISLFIFYKKGQKLIKGITEEPKDSSSFKKLAYIEPDELYELNEGETVDDAIERLMTEMEEWLDRWIINTEAFDKESIKINRKLRISNFAMLPDFRDITSYTKAMRGFCTRSDDIMQQIEIRFEIIFELIEGMDDSVWEEIGQLYNTFATLYDNQRILSGSLYNIKVSIRDNNNTFGLNKKERTIKKQQALNDCDVAVKAQQSVVKRVKWIMQELEEYQ